MKKLDLSNRQSLMYPGLIAACLLLLGTVVWLQGQTIMELKGQITHLASNQMQPTSVVPPKAPTPAPPSPVSPPVAPSSNWIVAMKVDLQDVVLTQSCLGSIDVLSRVAIYKVCQDQMKLTATVKSTGKEYDLFTTSTHGSLAPEALQLGKMGENGARVFFKLEGLADCESDLTGCWYNFTVKLSDLGNPAKLYHLYDSDVAMGNWLWNSDYTKAIGLVFVCEGGCVPQPLFGGYAEKTAEKQLTTDEAWDSREAFNAATLDYPNPIFNHWGEIKWTDATHYSAQILDPNGKVIKTIKGEFR